MARLGAGADTDAAEDDAMSGSDEGTEEIRRLRQGAESDPMNEQTERVTRRSGSISEKEEQITSEPSAPSSDSSSDSGGSGGSSGGSSSGGSTSGSTSGSGTATGSTESSPVNQRPRSTQSRPSGDSSSSTANTSSGGDNQPATTGETTRFNPESSSGPTPTAQGVEQYGRTDKYVQYEGERVSIREAARRFELAAAEKAGVSPEDTAVLTPQTPGDTVTFQLSYTQEGEARATADALRTEYGVGDDVVTTEGDEVVVDTRGLNESVMTRPGAPGPTARAEGKSMQTGGSTSDRINAALGGYKAAASQTGSRVGEPEPTPASRRSGDDTARFISRQIAASRASEATGRDVSVEDVQIRDGEIQVTQNEQLGDIDWSFGMGGPEDEVEQALEGASRTVMDAGEGFANFLFDEKTGAFRNPAGDDILRAVGQDQLAEDYEQGAREFSKGVARGSAALLNVPGLAKTGLEAAETTQYVAGDIGPRFSETKEFGMNLADEAISQAQENQAGTAGLLAGSLVGSYGIMKAGSKIGSRTGAATRYAIQPGEELAGTLGYKATKATAGTRAADRLFPMQEPLIFSEEAAIMAAKRASPKVRAAGSRLRAEAKSTRFAASEMFSPDIETRAGPSGVARRAQQELVSARFKLAEMTGGPDAPRLETEFETEGDGGGGDGGQSPIRQFLGEERGQTSLGQTRTRQVDVGETDLDSGMQRGIELTETRSSLRSDFEMETELDVESATQPAVEMETGTRSRTRFEPAFGDAFERQTMAETPELGFAQELGMEARSRADTDILSRADTELGVDQELGLEQETFLDIETEVDTEFRFESELEQELELEAEQELELETEVEAETRHEVEPLGMRVRRRRSNDPFGSYDESSSILERSLLNPFTGE